MRTGALKRFVTLSGPALFVVSIAFCSFAQQSSRVTTPSKSTCSRDNASASSAVSQSGKAQINLLQSQFRVVRSKCDFFTIAPARTKPINLRRVELFSSEAFVANPIIGPKLMTKTGSETTQAQGQPDSAAEAQELAKKLNNPVASLISVPLQNNIDFGMGAGSGWRYTLNVQPVIPIKLSDKWNLISRTIVPIIHQGNVTGPNTGQSGLGDTTQSLFFSPNKSEPFIWAVGPAILLPTATDRNLGTQKWGLGPTALILKQKEGWTYGILANHIWSVAGKSNRSDVSSTFLQPFLAYTNKQAWTYTINTESTYDWVSNSWSVPINPLVSKLVRFGKQPISFGGGLRCWVTSPTGGPEKCGIRFVVTALFPKK